MKITKTKAIAKMFDYASNLDASNDRAKAFQIYNALKMFNLTVVDTLAMLRIDFLDYFLLSEAGIAIYTKNGKSNLQGKFIFFDSSTL